MTTATTGKEFSAGKVFVPGDVHPLTFWAKHLGGADFDEVKRWRWRLAQAVRDHKLKALPRKGDKDPVQVAAIDLQRWLDEGQDGALSPQELRDIKNS